jgi:AmpE protein
MAIALVAAVIALLAAHTLPDLQRVRQFGWFFAWQHSAARAFGARQGPLATAIVILVPALALFALQYALTGVAFGLLSLMLSALVLFYCWGPRDLDLDVDAVATAPDAERRRIALAALSRDATVPTLHGTALIDAVFRAALSRWFAVLFWFVLLGPAGALLYRLTDIAARAESADPAQRDAAARFLALLDWAPAQLMTLALAVAGDFDAVAAAWRDFHAARGRWFTLDNGFLIAAARASVESDMDSGDTYVEDARGPIAEMQDAMALVWRILLVWGVVFALFVLAGRIT